MTVHSRFGHLIRLSQERWSHIVESHDYMAGRVDTVLDTIGAPDCIVLADSGEHYALKRVADSILGEKTCVVVYRDQADGFVITALMTSKPEQFQKRGGLIWKK